MVEPAPVVSGWVADPAVADPGESNCLYDDWDPSDVRIIDSTPAEADVPNFAGQIRDLAELHAQGLLSDSDFEKAKEKILA